MKTADAESCQYATRLPAMSKYNVSTQPDKVKEDLNVKLPPSIRWKADNYNHLHEQPTVFYAVALSLAILGTLPSLSDTPCVSHTDCSVQATSTRTPRTALGHMLRAEWRIA